MRKRVNRDHELDGEMAEHVQKIVSQAVTFFEPDKIYLFGSRARGDAQKTSDYDIAFSGVPKNLDGWLKFKTWIEEHPPSLYTYDLVDLDHCAQTLKMQILNEGKLIYVKK